MNETIFRLHREIYNREMGYQNSIALSTLKPIHVTRLLYLTMKSLRLPSIQQFRLYSAHLCVYKCVAKCQFLLFRSNIYTKKVDKKDFTYRDQDIVLNNCKTLRRVLERNYKIIKIC